MLVQYCTEALKQAVYKQLEDASWFVEIPGFQGVWANAESVEATREELFEVLQEWLVLKLKDGDVLPVVKGIDLNVRTAA
jgi:predicted RNase H-like HicB family nuclease